MNRSKLNKWGWLLVIILFYAILWPYAQIDFQYLIDGLPTMFNWLQKSWPPDLTEIPIFLQRALETVAIATIGTTFAAIIALPISFLAASNMNPNKPSYYFIRMILNALRGVDSFVFALIFVAAVGLGPFAGLLGVAIHTIGSMAKMFAEWIENAEMESIEALEASGCNRLKVIVYALLPDAWPSFTSVALYFWEFNVRASTVLGVVGAGGIGQELKNSMDLLDFSRLLTILVIISIMVTIIDRISVTFQRRLQ
jgi:phosphonate transport system permease protein